MPSGARGTFRYSWVQGWRGHQRRQGNSAAASGHAPGLQAAHLAFLLISLQPAAVFQVDAVHCRGAGGGTQGRQRAWVASAASRTCGAAAVWERGRSSPVLVRVADR